MSARICKDDENDCSETSAKMYWVSNGMQPDKWNTAEMDASGGRSHCFTISKGNKESYSEHPTWNDAEDDVMQVIIFGICSEFLKSKHTINSETGQDNCLLEMTNSSLIRKTWDILVRLLGEHRYSLWHGFFFTGSSNLSYPTIGIPTNSPRISGV